MKPKLSTCPTCGSEKLKLLRSDFTLKVGSRVIVVPKLERYRCSQCGEILFDYDGIKRIEEARAPRRKLSRTA